jgi:hypothetical protein
MHRFYYKAIKTSIMACLTIILAAQTPFAKDLSIKIDESTLNEVAAVIEPLEFEGRHKEFFCDSNWKAEVKDLNFKITESGISVTGKITGSWCAGLLTFKADLDTTGDLYYSTAEKSIIVFLHPSPVALKKEIDLWISTITVTLKTIDASKYLNAEPIKVHNAKILFESGDDRDWLTIEPSDIALNVRNGFIEFESNAVIK